MLRLRLLQSPAIAGDCYVLFVLFLIFFRLPNFRRPCADFRETLPHEAVCAEIVYLLYGCSYVPPNKFEGRKTPFLPIFGPKIDTWSPAIP